MCDRLLASDRAVDVLVNSVHEANSYDDFNNKGMIENLRCAVSPNDDITMQSIMIRDQRTTRSRTGRSTVDRFANRASAVTDNNNVVVEGCDRLTSTITTTTTATATTTTTTRCCGDFDVRCNGSCCFDNARTQKLVNMYSKVSRSCDDVRKDFNRRCFRPTSYHDQLAARTTSRFPNSCTTWLRLGGLLVALLAVTVHGAPTMTLEDRRLSSTPKWLNPCGFAAEEFDGDLDVVQLNDETLLGNIVMQAKTALNYAQGFRDDYIKRTFNTDYADLHLTWKDNHYDWLPSPKQIPKQLGEQLDQEFLDKLEVRMLDTALLDAYEYMQRFAVGLEQIAWDQEDYSLEFRKQFKDIEYNLRSVLCELQMALAERGVTPRADITREVMSREFRDMSHSATYRNLRDWLIFRDYMNGLEYIIQVFEHFVRGIKS